MVPSVSTEHEDFEEVEEGIHPTAKYSSFTPPVYSSAWGIDETKRFYEVNIYFSLFPTSSGSTSMWY